MTTGRAGGRGRRGGRARAGRRPRAAVRACVLGAALVAGAVVATLEAGGPVEGATTPGTFVVGVPGGAADASIGGSVSTSPGLADAAGALDAPPPGHASLAAAPPRDGAPTPLAPGPPRPLLRRLTGRVLDDAGRPLGGATVTAWPTSLVDHDAPPPDDVTAADLCSGDRGAQLADHRPELPIALTDADGRFAFGDLGAPPRTLRVDAPGFVTVHRPLHASPSGDLGALRLQRGGRLRGALTDAQGYFVPRRRVFARPVDGGPATTTWTDRWGEFCFGRLRAGTWRLGADLDGLDVDLSPQGFPVDVVRDHETETTLVLPPRCVLRGVVLRDGLPSFGTHVVFESGDIRAQDVTDTHGAFRLTVSRPVRGALAAWHDGAPRALREVEVFAEGPRDVTLAFDVGVLRGRVLDAHTGEPVVCARIDLVPPEMPAPRWVSRVPGGAPPRPGAVPAATDDRGRFALEELVTGAWHVAVTGDDHLPHARAPVTVGEQPAEIDIRLEPAASLRGTVRDVHGAPVTDHLLVELRRADGTREDSDEPGDGGTRFALHGLPPGDYELVVRTRDFSSTRRPWRDALSVPVHLDPGADLEHDVTLPGHLVPVAPEGWREPDGRLCGFGLGR